MRLSRALFVIMGVLSLGSIDAAPAVWTPASDALPSSTPRFTETPVGRFEAIAVGSFPIALFYVGFGFDLATFVRVSVAENQIDLSYAPWPFKSSNAPALSQAELGQRLGATVALSLGVAVLDAILRPIVIDRKNKARPDSSFPKPPEASSSQSTLPESAKTVTTTGSGETTPSAEGSGDSSKPAVP
ncbi:MAG TPA: hypothetical protein VMV83_07840 [Rectinemataceae bacterium]|nr:hypothetical protein [Rectinemataceae bacterium]